MRLSKFLANSGVASRRKAEELIEAGRVAVNGKVVTEQGTKVDPATDVVTVDRKRIESTEKMWIALHKPRSYMCTRADPQGRKTIYDLLPKELQSLFYVGRLEYDSEGLLLLTNDGDAAHRLLHPSFEVARVYDAIVDGAVTSEVVKKLSSGVELADGIARAESVSVQPGRNEKESRVRLALREGRKREVRRMMSAVGHEVRRLRRVSYGPIKLGRLAAGEWRELTEAELKSLHGNKRT